MICKKCGHQFEGNFCNNCGTRANKKGGFTRLAGLLCL